jgi:hypothetical protein
MQYNTLELGAHLKKSGLISNASIGLSAMSQILFGKAVSKELRMSDWARPLDHHMTLYAAVDVWVSYELWKMGVMRLAELSTAEEFQDEKKRAFNTAGSTSTLVTKKEGLAPGHAMNENTPPGSFSKLPVDGDHVAPNSTAQKVFSDSIIKNDMADNKSRSASCNHKTMGLLDQNTGNGSIASSSTSISSYTFSSGRKASGIVLREDIYQSFFNSKGISVPPFEELKMFAVNYRSSRRDVSKPKPPVNPEENRITSSVLLPRNSGHGWKSVLVQFFKRFKIKI